MPLSSRLQDEAVTPVVRTRVPWLIGALGAAVAGVWVSAGAAGPPAEPAGRVRIGLGQPGGRVRVEAIDLEDYVARVVSGEGQPKAGPAAQQALAIVIRTFALANLHRHRAEGYDLCDTTHCQVLRPATPAAREAARATAGTVLLDRGRPAFVFYSAHNGGTPALASEVWPGATDYAPSAAHDDACADDPGWTSTIPVSDLERALRAAGATGTRLTGLGVIERTASDRAGRLRAEGFTPPTLSAHEFRMAVGRTLGWQLVRSTAFEVERQGQAYVFTGVGYGHGVGLCVIGAGKRAARGESAPEILRTYFRDLSLGSATGGATTMTAALASRRPSPVPSPAPESHVHTPPAAAAPMPVPVPPQPSDVVLILPPEDEGERSALLALVRETREIVAARALVPPPARLAVTAHASLDAFGRATGQPWWVPASTVGTAIDLAPISALRQRGVLESTIRYEVASAVVAPHLTRAPGWARVGAAIMLSAPPIDPAVPPPGRVACPTDAELFRPVSGGAQREAFLRAERCVRREVGRGRALTALR